MTNEEAQAAVRDYICDVRKNSYGDVIIEFSNGESEKLTLDFPADKARILANRILALYGDDMDRLGLV